MMLLCKSAAFKVPHFTTDFTTPLHLHSVKDLYTSLVYPRAATLFFFGETPSSADAVGPHYHISNEFIAAIFGALFSDGGTEIIYNVRGACSWGWLPGEGC
jgi:hypothetical protein